MVSGPNLSIIPGSIFLPRHLSSFKKARSNHDENRLPSRKLDWVSLWLKFLANERASHFSFAFFRLDGEELWIAGSRSRERASIGPAFDRFVSRSWPLVSNWSCQTVWLMGDSETAWRVWILQSCQVLLGSSFKVLIAGFCFRVDSEYLTHVSEAKDRSSHVLLVYFRAN